MTEKKPFNIGAKADQAPKRNRPAEMFLVVDIKTRELLTDPALNNVACIFYKYGEAEAYQKTILWELRRQTDIVIKYPQFLNMAEVQQLEALADKCDAMVADK
jgi:hypothetical protein